LHCKRDRPPLTRHVTNVLYDFVSSTNAHLMITSSNVFQPLDKLLYNQNALSFTRQILMNKQDKYVKELSGYVGAAF